MRRRIITGHLGGNCRICGLSRDYQCTCFVVRGATLPAGSAGLSVTAGQDMIQSCKEH